LNATVAPIGLAWKESMDNDPDSLINLYSMDNSHPSLAGSYLTACVMYATMFQKSPEGSIYLGGLPEGQVIYLQQIANNVVLNGSYNFSFYDPYFEQYFDLNWLDWIENGSVVWADFSIAAMGPDYSFTSQTINAVEFLWDFGDGNSSILENPIHTFENNGQYLVNLTASNDCFSINTMDSIQVIIPGATDYKIRNNIIAVTNISGLIQITLNNLDSKKVKYNLINQNGKLIFSGDFNNNFKQLNISHIPKGAYFVIIEYKTKRTVHKIILR